MTKREYIRKRVSRVMGALSVLASCAIASLICSQIFKGGEAFNFLFFFLAAFLFVMAGFSFVFITYFVWCPDCRKPIGLAFLVSGIGTSQKWIRRGDWGANNCPQCGTDLNQEMTEK